MNRAYYSDRIENFLKSSDEEIIGKLAIKSEFPVEQPQKNAWMEQINVLKDVLKEHNGSIYFEFSIPRMGQRIDVLLIINSVIFILEFKVGEREFNACAVDQVWDYALDLKNFHETSHYSFIAPVLIPTKAKVSPTIIATTPKDDKLLLPIKSSVPQLKEVIKQVLVFAEGDIIDISKWEKGAYHPTPTIVEAATALYGGHSVEELSRSDAGAKNLTKTSNAVAEIIEISRDNKQKSICFVTGVPGSGKTLVGLNIATTHINKESELYSVFLSGNGPLVSILREALARDKVEREKKKGSKIRKSAAMSEVKMFIQNVHNFRDDSIEMGDKPPLEHVALFDEAQRAWDMTQTSSFMRRKKNISNFNISEPEYLISCLDKHKNWAVIVCLVGGGQEINTGEAGISEWIESLNRSFPDWRIYISPNLHDSEYAAGKALDIINDKKRVEYKEELHLAVSMRSFRAENVSLFVKQLLDLDAENAAKTYIVLKEKYPLTLTRDLLKAKKWVKEQARGTERYGIVVSSAAERLKPYAIDVKSPMNPIHWFLESKEDVRSSYYMEQIATEFHVQGLELDWACVTWDADFRYTDDGWNHWEFRGKKWNKVKKETRQRYLKNAYRVLLTRARQGMVIVVPEGDKDDPTRKPEFYDSTYEYLKSIGLETL